jgi:hypothetical protein
MATLADLVDLVDEYRNKAAKHLADQRNNIQSKGVLRAFMENLAEIAQKGESSAQAAGSVVPEVAKQGREELTGTGLGLLGAIKAYHGSPHKFDKFSMDKIGTGEGAQAYGHGLYFAENPEVAKSYTKVGDTRKVAEFAKADGQKFVPQTQPEILARNALADNRGDPVAAAAWLDEMKGMKYSPVSPDEIEKAKDVVATLRYSRPEQLYEVSLRWPDAAREAADPLGPQHFLDWDKPLSQQPESVRKAVTGADKRAKDSLYGSGGEYYRALGSRYASDFPPHVSVDQAENMAQAPAAAYLRSLGIPGIRYLDGGSRSAGQGTANYVAFDDALVEILRRNGVMP